MKNVKNVFVPNTGGLKGINAQKRIRQRTSFGAPSVRKVPQGDPFCLFFLRFCVFLIQYGQTLEQQIGLMVYLVAAVRKYAA